MKKILTLLLCSMILFNTCGFYFAYFQIRSYFKQIAFNRINEYVSLENINVIKTNPKFTCSEMQIFERVNDNEILYLEKMYDICKEERRGDTLVLYCLNDENEDKLNHAFAEFVKWNNNGNGRTPVKSLLNTVIKIALSPKEIVYNNFKFFNVITLNPLDNLQNVIIDVSEPPPRNA